MRYNYERMPRTTEETGQGLDDEVKEGTGYVSVCESSDNGQIISYFLKLFNISHTTAMPCLLPPLDNNLGKALQLLHKAVSDTFVSNHPS